MRKQPYTFLHHDQKVESNLNHPIIAIATMLLTQTESITQLSETTLQVPIVYPASSGVQKQLLP